MAPVFARLALLSVLAAGLEMDTWSPKDGVKAYDAVEKALTKVLSVHMSPEQSKRAQHVADDVRKAIAAVETSSSMTKAQRQAKIGAAVKELFGLESDMKREMHAALSGREEGLQAKMARLQAQLKEKKEELAKDEAMIKMATLQKELAEKKLQLQKLIEQKSHADASKKAEAEDASQLGLLVDKLLKVTGPLAKVTDKSAKLPAPIMAALSEVEVRSKKESEDLARMDATNKKTMAELDAQMKSAKGQGKAMVRRLKKEEHREYLKVRAHKQNEVSDLKAIQQNIEQHDAKKLQATLTKMQHEAKALAAKAGNFLH